MILAQLRNEWKDVTEYEDEDDSEGEVVGKQTEIKLFGVSYHIVWEDDEPSIACEELSEESSEECNRPREECDKPYDRPSDRPCDRPRDRPYDRPCEECEYVYMGNIMFCHFDNDKYRK
jgi:hypothetical protein